MGLRSKLFVVLPLAIFGVIVFGVAVYNTICKHALFMKLLAGQAEPRIFIDLVDHHQDGRRPPKTLDMFEPVFGGLLLPGIEHQHVDAALGQEKLVRGVHDLLAAEIPEANVDRVVAGRRMGEVLVPDVDAVRLRLVGVKPLAHQPLDERRFAGPALPDEQDLDLIHGAHVPTFDRRAIAG